MSLDNIRTYEVSIWTLQDGFISVLKYANLENKGQIQEGIVDIQTDGTQNLSFSVPLYLNVDGVKQENHFWYNFINATTVVNMRKIKVALNKSEEDEKIYEFLITKVTERHEEDQAYCDVECEGLAFHELGKVGYKISLSSDKFYDDDMKWFETKKGTQPRATLDYWLGEMGLEKYSASQSLKHPTTWYYEVSMNWDAYPGEDRVSNKVYEDEYISSWKIENGKIIPDGVTVAHEKERMVDLEESNIYNLTQELAETFGVFCRYEYLYDSSEHIIGRKIVFYNNFIAEEEGYIDLSYPHSASSIHREIDSTDLVTKMYVRPVDNEFSASGQTTIMDVGANKSREDYLLNFDYLYAIGTITQEQYDEIKVYEKNIREKNNALIPIEEKLIYLSNKLIDLEASLTVATNSIQQDEERLSAASQLENELRNKYGDEYGNTIAIPTSNPRMLMLITDSKAKNGTCYVNLDDTGIDVKTLKIYRNFDSTKSSQLSEELTSGILEYDEYGELIKVTNLKAPSDPAASMRVYAVYSYNPQFYYQKVIDTWTTQLYKDQENKAALEDDSDLTAETSVPAVKHQIEELEAEQTTLLEEKKKLIADFEHMMGPALREGYWQPEDYSDYGSNYTDTFMLPNTTTSISGESKKSSFIWNSEPFEDEQKTYYEIGINQDKKYYPCVDLSEHLEQVKEHIDELCFIYYDYDRINTDAAELNKRRTMPVGSLAQYGFTMKNGKIIPVLILTGIEKLPSESIDKIKSANADPVIGMLKATVSQDGREVNVVEERLFSAIGNFITLTSNSKLYFPRLKVNSLALKTSSDQLGIVYNNNVLQPFEDYYSLIRKSAYYVTLKPRALLAQGTVTGKVEFKYSISNADVAIYLDAVQVLKESAFPKVSYTVSPNFVDKTILHQTYELLNRLVHINDSDLKFQNIRGYISGVKLNLDKPWEDEIEIKNYKNKFEDLFSTIVAQTEQMKKNSYIIGMAANAFSTSGGLTSESFDATIKNNSGILKEYLKSNFDDVFVVREQLQEAFDEAGQILKDASDSLDSVKVLTAKNADILASFAENVAAGLTPKTYNSSVKPSNFKPGDVWNETDDDGNIIATYVATTAKDLVETYDGNLSRITGANMSIDARTGVVDITGENEINLKSGKNIYIGADDNVDIVGNKAVNIGGTVINIGTSSTPANKVGGIHLVSSNGSSSTSKVDIAPTGIELASVNGVVIKSGAGIDIKSSDGNDTSAVIIDKDKGIWLGANKGINLYSGINSAGEATGATVAINPDKLLFGVSNTTSGTTAAEMTSDYIVLAAGNVSESDKSNKNITGTSNGLVGVKITKNTVGLATGSGTNINTVLMNNNGVTIGAGSIDITQSTANLRKLTDGSYVRVSGSGIDLGSTSNLYINSNNFKLQTNTDANSGLGNTIFAIGSDLNDITKSTTPAEAQEKGTVNFLVNDKGAYIKGAVYATSGSFTGAIYATSFNVTDGSGNTIDYIDKIDSLQNQIDNTIDTWFGTVPPTLNNEPAVNWSNDEKKRHLGDLYYNNADGNGYRFIKSGSTYKWEKIPGDSAVAAAATKIEKIANGEIGLMFTGGEGIQSATLNNNAGLVIQGKDGGYFRVTNDQMGFLSSSQDPLLYYENGSLYLKGTLFANKIYVKYTGESGSGKLFDAYIQDKVNDLDYMTTVNNRLKSLFDEAGIILDEAGSAIETTHALSAENKTILTTFLNEAKNLNPKIFTSSTRPASFKPGDIWEPASGSYKGNRYIATSYSEKSSVNDNPLGGWNKVTDGSLDSIVGAGIDIDATAGTIDLKAGSKISLKAKSQLDLTSGDIQITGNNSINIGSKWVNIGAANGGINIISTNITNNTTTDSSGKVANGVSKVQINRDGIVMHGNKIELMATDTNDVAALSLDPTKGVWLGSSQEVRLFSGSSVLPSDTSGTGILLTPLKLQLGIGEGSSGSSIVMDKTQVLLASGSIADLNATTKITTTASTAGVQIQKDYIGLAAGSGTSRSLVSIKPTRVLIGNGFTNENNYTAGNYILMDNANGEAIFEVGTTGIFKILSPMLKIDNSATGTNNNLYIADNATWSSATQGIKYSANGGLEVKGAITSISGTIGGWTMGANRLYSRHAYKDDNNNDRFTYAALYDGTPTSSSAKEVDMPAIWVGDYSGTSVHGASGSAAFLVKYDGSIKATKGTIGGWVIGTNFIGNGSVYGVTGGAATGLHMGSAGSTSLAFWAGYNPETTWTTANIPFLVRHDGTIRAAAGTIGGWTLAANRLYSGSSTTYVGLDSNASNTYAIWAGSATDSSAPFRVKRNGEVYLTKLMVKDSSGNYKEINFNTYGTGGWNEDFFSNANVKVYVGADGTEVVNDKRVQVYGIYKIGDKQTTTFVKNIDCTNIYKAGQDSVTVSKVVGTVGAASESGDDYIATGSGFLTYKDGTQGPSVDLTVNVTSTYVRAYMDGVNDTDAEYTSIGSITEIGSPPSETLYWYDRNSNTYRVYGTSVYRAGSTYNNLYQKS